MKKIFLILLLLLPVFIFFKFKTNNIKIAIEDSEVLTEPSNLLTIKMEIHSRAENFSKALKQSEKIEKFINQFMIKNKIEYKIKSKLLKAIVINKIQQSTNDDYYYQQYKEMRKKYNNIIINEFVVTTSDKNLTGGKMWEMRDELELNIKNTYMKPPRYIY